MTHRELCTVLAALRYWQEGTTTDERKADAVAIDGGSPLTDNEIDALCEQLTTGAERNPGIAETEEELQAVATARNKYTLTTDDVEIDRSPRISVGDDGIWVSAWLRVSHPAQQLTADAEQDDDEQVHGVSR